MGKTKHVQTTCMLCNLVYRQFDQYHEEAGATTIFLNGIIAVPKF